jgi:tetratricopeptide (TPR) repeat protein
MAARNAMRPGGEVLVTVPIRGLAWRAALLSFLALQAAPARADDGDALDTGGGGIAGRYVEHAQNVMAHEHITEALALADRALAIYPHYMFAHFTHARALMASGQYDAAAAEFTSTIAAHPDYPAGYLFRGLTYLRARQPARAVEDFDRALQAPVGMRDQMAANIFGYRSLAYQMLGKTDAAMADFAHSQVPLAGKTDDYSQLALLGYTAALVGLLDTAQLVADESISRHDRNILGYESRGLASLMRGDFDRAIADTTRSLYYRDDQVFAMYERGIAKRLRGDAAGGAADMAAAEAIDPQTGIIMARLGITEARIRQKTVSR